MIHHLRTFLCGLSSNAMKRGPEPLLLTFESVTPIDLGRTCNAWCRRLYDKMMFLNLNQVYH